MALSKRTEELLKKGENENIEYKGSITQDFNDILVSYANKEGGTCLFGVEDDKDEDGKHIGKIVGIEISDRTRGQIQSRADQTNDPIKIKIESEHDDEGRGIYIVTVFEGENKPYCTGGGRYLLRHNGQNCPITPNMMEGVIEHRINTSPTTQPIIRIIPKEISIHPSIEIKEKLFKIEEYLKDEERYVISIPIELTNIGNIPAQDIILDAEVHFAKRRPFDLESLPIHLYEFIDFLPSISLLKEMNENKYHINFDNFIAKEIILDFFENRKNFRGGPILPTEEEFTDKKIWPSPLISIKAIYSDINSQNYCSEIQNFFHLFVDGDKHNLNMYLLKHGEFGFKGVKKVSKRFREEYSIKKRYLRYSAFDGKEYPEDTLILLSVKWKEGE